jgi:hypothetical protein
MFVSYRVEQPEGNVIWSDMTAEYQGFEHVPVEHRDNRRVSSTAFIFINDELVSVVTPYVGE